jgi:hypothetical protein
MHLASICRTRNDDSAVVPIGSGKQRRQRRILAARGTTSVVPRPLVVHLHPVNAVPGAVVVHAR